MNYKPTFKVLKYSYYSGGKKELEQYDISMYGNSSLMCTREELMELQEQITLALNDQKEVENEKK